MPKKAILVSFKITTRLVIDAPEGADANLLDANYPDVLCRAAIRKLEGSLEDRFIPENIDSCVDDHEVPATDVEPADAAVPDEIEEFYFLEKPLRRGITDSLLLDSATEVLYGRVGDTTVSVRVCGDVRIHWKDQVYKTPSGFPDDLVQAIRDHELCECPDVSVDMSNWYEVFVKRPNNQHSEMVEDLNISSMTDADARRLILDHVLDI